MAQQCGVHEPVQVLQLRRVLAQQVRAELGYAGPCPLRIGRQVERTQRADLAMADGPFIGLDSHDRAVEHLNRLAAGPFVAALVQGQVDLVGGDPGDLHRRTLRRWSLGLGATDI
jgi:hypothetical protein